MATPLLQLLLGKTQSSSKVVAAADTNTAVMVCGGWINEIVFLQATGSLCVMRNELER